MRRNDPSGFREKGFTFLELVFVLVLMGLFMGLAAPWVMTTLDRIKADSSVRKMVALLASTRSRAVATKTLLNFQGDLQQNRYWVTDPETEKSSPPFPLDPTLQFREFDDGEGAIREGIFTIIFYPLGNTSGGTIVFEPSDSEAGAPSFELTLDPVTGKSYVNHAS